MGKYGEQVGTGQMACSPNNDLSSNSQRALGTASQIKLDTEENQTVLCLSHRHTSKPLPWCCKEEQGGMPGGRAIFSTGEQLCLETKRKARMKSRHIWDGEIPTHRPVARAEPVSKCELANGSPCMSQKSMFDSLGSVPNSSSVASHRGRLQRNEI